MIGALMPSTSRVSVSDWIQRVKRLVLLHKPLNLIDQILGALTVHILLVAPSEYVVDSFLFVPPLLDLHQIIIDLYNGLSPAMRLS